MDPSVINQKKKQNIKLHFDMHHGFGVLDRAINIMKNEDREKFREFVNKETKFNPHIMVISKKIILIYLTNLIFYLEMLKPILNNSVLPSRPSPSFLIWSFPPSASTCFQSAAVSFLGS